MYRFLIIVVAIPALAELPDVPLTVKAIGERCRSAREYSFEGEMLLAGQRGSEPGRTLSHAKVRVAVAPGGKSYLRIEPENKDAYVLVSNGKTSWAYVPKLKQYTEEEAASLDSDDDGDSPSDDERDPAERFARSVMPVLARLHLNAAGADFNGEAPVKYEKRKEKWPLLRVMSKPDANRTQSLTQLAIDPGTLAIGRMVYSTSWREGNVKSVIQMTLDFAHFDIGTVPESTFEFEPSKGTKLVDAVPIPGQSGSFLLNQAAPDFELKTLDGERVRLSDLRGHPVLLNFWASWCGPCRRELPTLSQLNDQYKDKGLVILGVNDEGKGTARRYAEQARLSFPTLDDSGLRAHRLYRVYNIPSVFLIDRNGKVVLFFKGAKDPMKLKASLALAGL